MTGTSQPELLAADEPGLARAAEILGRGGLVAVPTETVYGLAARADDSAAVAAIYNAKGRPDFNPLIVHVADLAAVRQLAKVDERADLLARHFWPGALTLVLPRRGDSGLAQAVTAGLPTVAVRCPAHPAMRALLVECGLPLAAPSANRSGAVSPTRAEHVIASLGERIDAVLDGGPSALGLESTIVALRDNDGWALLRPGPITERELSALLGPRERVDGDVARIEAPGQLTSHYSPGKPVRLDAGSAGDDEFHIGFGPIAGDVNLSPEGDLAEAASRLYAALHAAALSSKSAVAVAPIPHEGLGAALRDRLRRAAS